MVWQLVVRARPRPCWSFSAASRSGSTSKAVNRTSSHTALSCNTVRRALLLDCTILSHPPQKCGDEGGGEGKTPRQSPSCHFPGYFLMIQVAVTFNFLWAFWGVSCQVVHSLLVLHFHTTAGVPPMAIKRQKATMKESVSNLCAISRKTALVTKQANKHPYFFSLLHPWPRASG